MKSFLMASLLLLSHGVFASVVEMEIPAERVLEVYEEMRELQEEESADNGWIHEFENDSIGTEMDHLTDLKRAVIAREEM